MGFFDRFKRNKGPEPTISERAAKIEMEAHEDAARQEIKRQRKALKEKQAADRRQKQEEQRQQEAEKSKVRAAQQAERLKREAESRKEQRVKESARLKEEREKLRLRNMRERLEASKNRKPRVYHKKAGGKGVRRHVTKTTVRTPKLKYTVMEEGINTDGSPRFRQYQYPNISMARAASKILVNGGSTAIIYGPKGGKVAIIKPKYQRISMKTPRITPKTPRLR